MCRMVKGQHFVFLFILLFYVGKNRGNEKKGKYFEYNLFLTKIFPKNSSQDFYSIDDLFNSTPQKLSLSFPIF